MNSEQFARAAYSLGNSLDRFNLTPLTEASIMFKQSVDKLGVLLGMHAENQRCLSKGDQPFYSQEAFFNV